MAKRHSGSAWRAWLITGIMVAVLAVMWFSEDIFTPKNTVSSQTEQTSAASSVSSSKTDASASQTTAASESASALLKETVLREPLVSLKGNGKDTVTVLVYMNGSDLETEDGEATDDLKEMVASGVGGNVRVLVETLGTKKWKSTFGISSKTAQRYELTGNGLTLKVDKLGSLNVGDSAPLTDFIQWGAENYPADRYMLIFWDHGAGPVYGFGYDDRTGSEDTLTAYEMRKALTDAGVTFDVIGMDCCIMSSLELCCALYDFCDYMILSEDFESGYGWYYTDWLKTLTANPSVDTETLGKEIVDTTVSANQRHRQDSILAVIDEKYMKALYTAWVNFAYANEDTLIGTNYSRQKSRKPGGRVSPILTENGYFQTIGADRASGTSELESYFVTDIMSVAQNVSGEEAEALTSVLSHAVCYMNAYGDSANLTGLSVTLPYGDSSYYKELKEVFTACGFDEEYISWLEKFVTSGGSASYYNYDSWDTQWSSGGWDDYEDTGDSWWDYLFGYDDYYYEDNYWEDDYGYGGGGGWGWSHGW